MRGIFENEINLLCVGDVLSGKSSFLENYTNSNQEQLHYRVYPVRDSHNIVFLHEVEERCGMDAYLSYPYDGILYFLNIHDFHNPYSAILETVAQFSRLSGINIYSIPIRVVVLSAKSLPYFDISHTNKRHFLEQVEDLILPQNVVFVQDNGHYKQDLSCFYEYLLEDLTLQEQGKPPGILENAYVSWQLKGIVGFFPLEALILNCKKTFELAHHQWLKLEARIRNKYKENIKLQ